MDGRASGRAVLGFESWEARKSLERFAHTMIFTVVCCTFMNHFNPDSNYHKDSHIISHNMLLSAKVQREQVTFFNNEVEMREWQE